MAKRPNLLLITTDQMRGDCLGLARRSAERAEGTASESVHHPVFTPNLDHWFAHGAYFPRAYSECPSCIPARRTLITGQTPYGHGLPGYQDCVPFHPDVTMMGELAKGGYHTFGAGKMHFFPQRNLNGFHQTVLHEGRQRFGDYVDDYEEWLKCHTKAGERDHGIDSNSWLARPSHLPEELHVTNWTVTAAVDLLKRRDPDKPFFLWVSFIKPHAPLDPPQTYWDMYADSEVPPPPRGDWSRENAMDIPLDPNAWRGRLSPTMQRRAQIGYYALISHIDQQIGRLLEEMRKLKVINDTFMLMTADHGEMLGDHSLWRKTYAYEGSARVPFLVRFPLNDGYPAQREITEPVGLQDVMPTMLEAAGLPIPDSVEGKSVIPLINGDSSGWRRYIHGEHAECYAPEHTMQYLTDGSEKYIWFPATGKEQLFDLRTDPHERKDLARDPEQSHRVDRWRTIMIEHLAGRGDGLSDGRKLVCKNVRCEDYIERAC